MAVIDSLKFLITGDSSQFISETKRANRAAKETKGVIAGLKQGLGGRSTLKDVFEIAKGGGAIVGARFALGAINDAVSGLAELDIAIQKNNGNWKDWVSGIGRGIPITSQVMTLMDTLTGQTRALADAQKYLKEQETFLGSAKEFLGEADNTRNFMRDSTKDLNREEEMRGASETRKTFLTEFYAETDRADAAKKKIESLAMAAQKFRDAVSGQMTAGSGLAESAIDIQIRALSQDAAKLDKALAKRKEQIIKDFIGKSAGEKLAPAFSNVAKFFTAFKGGLEKIKQLGEQSELDSKREGLTSRLKELESFRPEPIAFSSLDDPGTLVQTAAAQTARMQFGPSGESEREKEIIRIRTILENLDRKISVN
mgnify:CR=1 FL=1